ncbi:MAG TPA: hypothetical protein VKA85_11955 [Candidatus Limnocylindrales bacterium]|nr:hypothetical protein [Candidatus Limnocylindrales bacterium]
MPPVDARRRTPLVTVFAAAVVCALVVACGQAPGGATGSGAAPASVPSTSSSSSAEATEPALTPVATAGDVEPGPSIGQTDTSWGRIWDELPRWFPMYPGATPTTDIGSAATAQLIVPADVPTTRSWMTAALTAAGFVTDVSGPLEDGSVTLDSTRKGRTQCKTQTTIAKQGGTTVMTILVATDCPFS